MRVARQTAAAGAIAVALVCRSAQAGGPSAPPNDACVNAIDIGIGNTPFNTTQATARGPVLPPTCDEGFGVSFVKDIWYRFTPTGSGILTVSTCGGANYDTRLAAYTGACAKLELVACNDDSPLCTGDRSRMQFAVTGGVPVLIRVGGFDAGGAGTLNLSSDIPPPNDDCANAITLEAGTHAVSTLNATTDGDPLPASCDEGAGLLLVKDVWFRHVPELTGTLQVSTCNTAPFDTRLAAYIDGPCGSLTLVGCNDDAGGCDFHTSIMIFNVVCGEPVLLRVGGYEDAGSMLLFIGGSGKPCPPPPDCLPDIDDNGFVNTDDLLALLGSWGPCPTPPDPCAGDIEPPGGNQQVDTDDLLAMLGAWGPCE